MNLMQLGGSAHDDGVEEGVLEDVLLLALELGLELAVEPLDGVLLHALEGLGQAEDLHGQLGLGESLHGEEVAVDDLLDELLDLLVHLGLVGPVVSLDHLLEAGGDGRLEDGLVGVDLLAELLAGLLDVVLEEEALKLDGGGGLGKPADALTLGGLADELELLAGSGTEKKGTCL